MGKRTRRFGYGVATLLLVGMLSACVVQKQSDPLLESDYLRHDIEYGRPEDKDSARVLVQILQAVDGKDKEALKGLFSKEALASIEDLDEKLEIFINTFPTWQSNYDAGFSGLNKHTNRSVLTRDVSGKFDFTSDGQEYVLYFVYRTDADENPNQIGLNILQIYERYIPGYNRQVSVQGWHSEKDVYLWDYTLELQDRKPLLKLPPFNVYHTSAEEKDKLLYTMTDEEIKLLIKDKDLEAYRNKEMYDFQRNPYYVSLQELRFAQEFFREKNASQSVVFDGVEDNYFDPEQFVKDVNDRVLFHYEEDPSKQYYLDLQVDGYEVTVTNEKELDISY